MTLPPDTIQRIMLRDDFKCVYCGYDGAASYDAWRHGHLCIDHFKSKKSGGGDEDENLVTACRACNSDKAHNEFASMEDARRWLRLYRKECSRLWFATYVVAKKPNPSAWNRYNQRHWERFRKGDDEPDA